MKDQKKITSPIELKIELKTCNYTITGLAWGDPDKYPILALHGWLDNAATFTKIAPLLDNYYVIAIDFPGHGQSSHKPPGEVYHFIDYVTLVFQILQHLDIKTCALLGHSMVAIASLAASAFPEKFQQLFLLDFIGPLSASPRDTPKLLSQHISEVLNFQPRPRNPKSLVDLIKLRMQVGNIPPEAAEVITMRNIIKDNNLYTNLYTWSYDPRLKISAGLRISEEQVLACLRNIHTQTQLFIAKSTYQNYFHQFDLRMQSMPKLKKYFFDSDHYLHFSHAESIAKKINLIF